MAESAAMDSSEGEFSKSWFQLNEFLSTEVNMNKMRHARESRTQRTQEHKVQMACAASPVTSKDSKVQDSQEEVFTFRLQQGSESGDMKLSQVGKGPQSNGYAPKYKGSEVLDSDYSEESEDLSEGNKSPARNMNMAKDRKMQTRRALKWGHGHLREGDVRSVPCQEHEDPSHLVDTIVELGPPASPAEMMQRQIKMDMPILQDVLDRQDAWISPPAEEHPELVTQLPDGPQGSSAPIRKIPQLPALGPSASLWRQRGFPEPIDAGKGHASQEGNSDQASEDPMDPLEPVNWRSRHPQFKNPEDQQTYSEFIDVSNPYVRALRAHREEIMRNTMDLQDMAVDTLPSRLATQRTDAVATLKTREVRDDRLQEHVCGPARCSEEDCMGGRDGLELLFLEPVHEDNYRPHSFRDGGSPRLSARGPMAAGTEELINSAAFSEAIEQQVIKNSWKSPAEAENSGRSKAVWIPASRAQAIRAGLSSTNDSDDEAEYLPTLVREEIL